MLCLVELCEDDGTMDNIAYGNGIGNCSCELKLSTVHLPIIAAVFNTFIARVWCEREAKKSKKKTCF